MTWPKHFGKYLTKFRMIVTIKKGNGAKGLINYHEKKIERGVGELILDSTFSNNKEQRIAEFVGLAELNRSVTTDRYTHMSVSFSEEDKVDRETQLKIAERYLNGMGYGDSPRLIYEHNDTGHRHFHIVTSTIDLNGKKIQIYRDHFRNQELSRQIEKEFGLTITEYFRQEQHQLQEHNAAKFGLLKGIEKLSHTPESRVTLDGIATPQVIAQILNEKLSNNDIKKILCLQPDAGKAFDQLSRVVRQSNAEYKTEKQQLRDRLNYIKDLSKSRDEFVQRCEQQNIYVRKIGGALGSSTFTYGVKETNFYLAEKHLPVALRHDYLFTGKVSGKSFDESKQRAFVQRIVTRCLKRSTTLIDFESLLQKAGVKVEYSTNARGRYGVSFQSANIRDAMAIKGSDIGLSWNKLQNYHTSKTREPDSVRREEVPHTKIPKALGSQLDTSNEDEDKRKKREGHDQSND
jgi:hypothetical protein